MTELPSIVQLAAAGLGTATELLALVTVAARFRRGTGVGESALEAGTFGHLALAAIAVGARALVSLASGTRVDGPVFAVLTVLCSVLAVLYRRSN